MRSYRGKRKADPELYQLYLEENRLKCKQFRDDRTDDQKKADSAKSKERTQKCRAKKKEEMTTGPQKVKTRGDILLHDAQKAKWNEEYRQKKENMHWRTKDAINAKRRLKYKENKLAPKIEKLKATTQEVQCGPADFIVEDERNPAAQRKALQRAKDALPSSPRKYVATVHALITKCSPRKKQLFHQKSFDTTAQKFGRLFIAACRRLKTKYCTEERLSRHVLLDVCKGEGSATYRSAVLGFDLKTVLRHGKKVTKKQKRKKEVETLAASFIEETATPLPDKKLVSMKTGKPAFQLRRPLREIYQDFCNSSCKKVSFSTFAKCRPRNIRLMSQAKLRQCLCEYCTNVQLKLNTVNTLATVLDKR